MADASTAHVSDGDETPIGPGSSSLTVVTRVLGWLFFAGGLVAAGFGIGTLQVVVAVVGLIVACTAGLTLLKLRTRTDPSVPPAEQS